MEFYRSAALHGSLRPRAENVIRGIPSQHLYHEGHGSKHPLAVYQTSMARVIADWLKAFELLDRLQMEVMCAQPQPNYAATLRAYESLLFRLNEHIDAAQEVLRSLVPPTHKAPRTHADFLHAVKLPGFSDFQKTIQVAYRNKHIGIIVNEVKHASAQLVAVSATTERSVVLGYFLDGARELGGIGPNLKLHHRFGHLETAFSFGRDMLMHFWWIYQISESICRCIEGVLAQVGVRPHECPPNPSTADSWAALCHECARIAPSFFVDECSKPYPIVVVPNDCSFVRLTYPTGRRPTTPRSMKVSVLLTVGEQLRSFTMPYMQEPRAVEH